MEMGAGVFLDVNGADFHFVEINGVGFHSQQHIGLVLEAVASDGIEYLQRRAGDGPQAGLGVGEGHAHENLEHGGSGLVAEAAAGRDILLVKVPAAEDDFAGFQHMLDAGAGIGGVVLVVAVHGDDAEAVGTVLQEPGESGFQSSALAAVDLVVQQVDFRVGSGGIREVMQVFLLAAVVNENDIGKAIFQQAVNDGYQLLIGVERGQDYRNFGKVIHKIASSSLVLCLHSKLIILYHIFGEKQRVFRKS